MSKIVVFKADVIKYQPRLIDAKGNGELLDSWSVAVDSAYSPADSFDTIQEALDAAEHYIGINDIIDDFDSLVRRLFIVKIITMECERDDQRLSQMWNRINHA